MHLLDHIENHIGIIDEGWKLQPSLSGIRVVSISGKPSNKVVTFITLGLSEHILPMPDGREVREELIFSSYEDSPKEMIVSFLLTFSNFIVTKHQALLRGDVVGPSDSIIPGISLCAVYSSIPVIYDDTFATFTETVPPTIFVWLIPIYKEEAEFIGINGWSQFEDILEAKDPDLFDLKRERIVGL